MTPAEWMEDLKTDMAKMTMEYNFLKEIEKTGLFDTVISGGEDEFVLSSSKPYSELIEVYPPVQVSLAAGALMSPFPLNRHTLKPSSKRQSPQAAVLNVLYTAGSETAGYWNLTRGRNLWINFPVDDSFTSMLSEENGYRAHRGIWHRVRKGAVSTAKPVVAITDLHWSAAAEACKVHSSERAIWDGPVRQTVELGAMPSFELLRQAMPHSSSTREWSVKVKSRIQHLLDTAGAGQLADLSQTLKSKLKKTHAALVAQVNETGVSQPWHPLALQHCIQKEMPEAHVVVSNMIVTRPDACIGHCHMLAVIHAQGPLSPPLELLVPQIYAADGFPALLGE